MSPRRPSTTAARTGRALLTALAAVAMGVLLSAACCGDTCTDPNVQRPPPPVPACAGAACAIATDGCDPTTISDGANGTVCATCTGADPICGVPDVARCELRENAAGAPCEVCPSASGEILYDSCYAGDAVAVAHCESAPAGQGSPTGDVVCETCTDANGAVVSTTCEPASDECHTVDDQGRSCRVCTQGGAVVVKACDQPVITPRSCEAYQNALGRCVDCYDDTDQLLLHTCTLASDTFISCTEAVTTDGLTCTSCVDANGGTVQRSCNNAQPDLQRCASLDYTDQTCIVCLDPFGDPAAWQCTSTTCVDPNSCDPPPDCFFEKGAHGEMCRTCPVAATGGIEQRCVVDTNLLCSTVPSGVPGTDPTQPSGTCLSCTDAGTGLEVYRRCDGGAAPPPACAIVVNAAGEQCEVCADQQTQQTVYSTCAGQTCYALGAFDVTGAQRNPLFVDNAPAVASCTECAVSADRVALGTDVNAACELRSDCGPVDLTAPQASCSGTVVFQVAPQVCDNAWSLAGYGDPTTTSLLPGGSAELVAVLGYTLEQSGVALVGIDDIGLVDPNAAQCANGTNGCGCARGDVLELAVRPQDAVAVQTLFSASLLRCASNADCLSGGACRVDGSCTSP